MKTRRHHNNKGYRQIQNGQTRKWASIMNKKIQDEKERFSLCCWARPTKYSSEGMNFRDNYLAVCSKCGKWSEFLTEEELSEEEDEIM